MRVIEKWDSSSQNNKHTPNTSSNSVQHLSEIDLMNVDYESDCGRQVISLADKLEKW